MLTLSRKTDQKIEITHGGEQLTILIVETGRNTRLGFDGPRSFNIRRAEVAPEQPEQQRYHGLLRERLRRERAEKRRLG